MLHITNAETMLTVPSSSGRRERVVCAAGKGGSIQEVIDRFRCRVREWPQGRRLAPLDTLCAQPRTQGVGGRRPCVGGGANIRGPGAFRYRTQQHHHGCGARSAGEAGDAILVSVESRIICVCLCILL